MSEKKHLTQSQFKKIAILLDIGEHVINSIRKTTDEDYDSGFNTIVEDAVKYAEKCGFNDLYTRDGDEIYWSNEVYKHVFAYTDDYDEAIFFDQLTDRLTTRDFQKKYGRLPNFDSDDKTDLHNFGIIHDMWESELDKHGIEHLEV